MQAQDGSIMGPMPPAPSRKEEAKQQESLPAKQLPVGAGGGDWVTSAAWGIVPALVVGAAVAVWMRVWVSRKIQPTMKLDGEIATLRELQEMVRTLLAELDRRTAMLEETIHAADQRLAMLEESRKAAVPEVRREPARWTRGPEPERHPLSDRVVEMASRGASAIEIARELGCPTGQVELILALRRAEEG